MNKTAIKNFAIWARRKLITDITYSAGLIGVSDKGIATPLPQSKPDLQFFDIGTKNYSEVSGKGVAQRSALVSAIKSRERTSDYKTAFQNVIEEVAYTWFNRLIAVRFMEVNDYLPSRVRVLSSETPKKNEPDFVTTPFDTDLDFTPYERDRVMQLKDETELDELFRMLFIKQCNKLNDILPELFEKTDDYSELLLTIAFTDKDGVVYHLTHDISEDDFNVSKEGQVEIIGWLYQYYNTEPKDEVFALLKKNVKITKERIPAATQLFTPDWIVRYMVENSLGRLWVEGHPNDALKAGWKYYLEEAEQEPSVQAQLEQIRAEYRAIQPKDIQIIDPCMGSGHILVYAFDVLMQIYEAQGYTQRDAARFIIEKNLYGLDIDRRAYQLAYFAVMMKARQYNRRILNDGIKPNLYAIQDSGAFSKDIIEFVADGNNKLRIAMQSIKDDLTNATEYGSIIDVAPVDFAALYSRFGVIKETFYEDIMSQLSQKICVETVFPIIKQAQCMAQKYHVVCTNPPYMGSSGMSAKLSDYVKTQYPDSKADLFSCFMERADSFVSTNGFTSLITMESWMFLSSFENLRQKINCSKTIINMVHMPYLGKGGTSLGINFGTAAVIMKKGYVPSYTAQYEYTVYFECDSEGVPFVFPTKNERWKTAKQSDFSKIPGSPIAYWVSDSLLAAFQYGKRLKDNGDTRQGMATSDNNRFLRFWYEVSNKKIGYGYTSPSDAASSTMKWFPYNKGGAYRKWYGNQDYVLNYEHDGKEVKGYATSLYKTPSRTIKSMSEYFKPCLSWSKVTTVDIAFRFFPAGFIFDVAGCCIFYTSDDKLKYDFGFLNSNVCGSILKMISPTMNYEAGHIASMPIVLAESAKNDVLNLVDSNIEISKSDWDVYENSWEFIRHPLITVRNNIAFGQFTEARREKVASHLSECFKEWESQCTKRFCQLKSNEEELNRIFINIYGLQNELTPEVEDKDVTVRKADLGRDIRSLISYAVGCMFGRYSLDVDGLAYAGGEWDGSKYKSFIPDADNCIPITDEEYFEDDIVGRFVAFIRTVYGAETLEENLDYIAKALGNKGNTSREIIRSYFLNDFFKNHCQIYQKRPIYWLFDSGKQNGFKALVYMHRWNADTTGNVRVEYLHRTQRVYEKEIERMQETIDNSRNAREVSAAEKRKEKLIKQLKEAKDYDAKIAHLALSRIDIDLDDGVKVNYEKVQTGQDGKVIEILAKI